MALLRRVLASLVSSFNGRTGDVTPQAGDYSAADVGAYSTGQVDAIVGGLTTSDIAEGTNLYYTTARVNTDAPNVTIGTGNGLSLIGQAMSLAAATTSTAGAMSAADKAKLDAATDANTASAIVRRDASGNFVAGRVTATEINLGGDSPITRQSAAALSFLGGALVVFSTGSVYATTYFCRKLDPEGGSNNTTLTLHGRTFSVAGTAVKSATGTFSASSGGSVGHSIEPAVGMSGSSSFTDFQIDRQQSSVGSGKQFLFEAKVSGASKSAIGTDGRNYIGTPNSAPTDSYLQNGQVTFYLDQSGNSLKVRVKYSDGTLKTGTLALT